MCTDYDEQKDWQEDPKVWPALEPGWDPKAHTERRKPEPIADVEDEPNH